MESWKDRLWLSRKEGVGFAAPGGEFTRAFGQWLMTEEGAPVRRALQNTPLVELGAGMYHFGYELAALTGCKSYTGVEPFYGDCLEAAIKTFKSERVPLGPKARVVSQDMLSFLKTVPDESTHILACGIEQCILPDYTYRVKVEKEIERVTGKRYVSLLSQSDLTPRLPVLLTAQFSPENRKNQDVLRVVGRTLDGSADTKTTVIQEAPQLIL